MILELALLSCIGILIFLYLKNVYKFWINLGVKQLNPIFPVGDILPLIRQKKDTIGFYTDLYERTKHEKFIGIYNILRPFLFVNDPELVKTIMVQSFSNFTDHGSYVNEEYDPLSGHLYSMPGDRWKNCRGRLNAAFSPAKIKGMFPVIGRLAQNVQKHVQASDTVEIFDLAARYTTDFVASVAYGLENDSFKEPDNSFHAATKRLIEPTLMNKLRHFGNLLCPKMMVMFGMHLADKDVEEYFVELVRVNLEHREKTGDSRADFLQFMIQLRNKGHELAESKNMTIEEVTGHLFMFLAAGYETTSATMSACLYELARNPLVQRKVQAELDTIHAEHSEFTYESIQEMTYLEQVIDETLRMYPPLPILLRQCVQDFEVPDSKIVIPANTMIMLPIVALQRDEACFPEPMKFMPERFTDPNQLEAMKNVYHPFGNGPRVCIGMRMGKVLLKLGLAHLLAKSNYELLAKDVTFEVNKAHKDGIRLRVSQRG